MGFLARTLTAMGVRNQLAMLTGANRLDASAIKNLPSGGGGLTAWSLKTANYTAIAGDRLRIDATAGDVVITLPASPSTSDADIWIQRLDLTANKVLLRTGSNKINSQSDRDGVFMPIVAQLIERISYVNATIGWLGQHDRLTYQAAPQPVGVGSGILNLPFDTNLLDISAIAKSVTNNNVVVSSAQSVFGGSSAYFNGTNASLAIPRDGSTGIDLRPAAISAYTIEMWLYPELINARNIITNYSLPGGAQSNTLVFQTGAISNGVTAYINATGIVANQWQHVAIVVNNASPNFRFYRQGNLVGSVANNFSQSASTLYIGGSPGDNNIGNAWYQGWIDNLIITPSEKYTTNFIPPTTP